MELHLIEGQEQNNAFFPFKDPLGYIVVDNEPLVAFGLLPPDVEATAIKDPSKWREVKVCPTQHVLSATGRSLNCPVDFCNEPIRKNNTYENHVRKHLVLIIQEQHKMSRLSLPVDLPQNLRIRYYCKESSCYNGMEMFDQSRSFDRLKYLKQHYLKMHAPKTFKCTGCSKSFATVALLGVHMRNCGNSFDCSSCTTTYDSLEALQTHCRRKGHTYNYSKYKDILYTAKLETLALRQADKDLKSRLAAESEPKKVVPVPLHILVPRPTAITTCGGATSHVAWTYDTSGSGTDAPKFKVEMSTQTDIEDESPVSSTSSAAIGNRSARRKRSAETQTSRLKYKISTETQTLNVTKRRRTSKRHIAEAETQCSVAEPNTGANEREIINANASINNLPDTLTSTEKNSPTTGSNFDDFNDSGICLPTLMSLIGIEGENDIEILSDEHQSNLYKENAEILKFSNIAEVEINEINWNSFHSIEASTSTSEVCVGNTSSETGPEMSFAEELHRETQTDSTFNFGDSFGELFYASGEGNDISEMLNLVTTETQTGFGAFSLSGPEFELDPSAPFGSLDSGSLSIPNWNTTLMNGSQTEFFGPYEENSSMSIHEGNRNSPSYMETIDGETQTGLNFVSLLDDVLQ